MKRKLYLNDVIGILLFILFLIFGLYIHFKASRDSDYIKERYEKTIGEFVRYDRVGGSGNPYLTYYYHVEGKKYINQIGGCIKYDFCYKNNSCKVKRFWVIYSPTDPSKSLIDLTVELQNMENIVFPETLDNFK